MCSAAKKILTAVTSLLLALMLHGCADEAPSAELRVGFNPWPGYEFIYLAKVKGFYEDQGLAVKLVELNSLGDVRRAFERGQIDVMASTIVEVLIAAENSGRQLQIIAVSDASNGADALLTTSSITRIEQLKGKRVGMEGATVDVLVAGAALRSAGLSFNDIEVVAKAQDDLVADLEAGHIDAMETYPPYSVRLLKSGRFHAVFDTSQIPGEIIDTLAVDARMLDSRREDIQRFLRAYFKAFDYFAANREEAGAIMGQREGISADEFLQALGEMQILDRSAQTPYLQADNRGGKALQRASEALVATGWLKNPADVQAFFDPHAEELLH